VTHFCRTNADKEGWDNKYRLDGPDKFGEFPLRWKRVIIKTAHRKDNSGVNIPRTPSCADEPCGKGDYIRVSEVIQNYEKQLTKQPNYRRRKSHDKKEYLHNPRVSMMFSFTPVSFKN